MITLNKIIMNKNMTNLLTILKKSLIKLPTPINISYWWNFGSLLGLFLSIQIISGFFLSMHYCCNTNYAFKSIIHIIQDINLGWLLHNIHINGASMYFICMYVHIGRGIYYSSYKLTYTWIVGISIYVMSMATAFLGYVLPWGQMSFWGATVITNLISTIPYIGNTTVQWIWGGFSINNATLNRFYSLHFILPFMILFLVMIHLYFLHLTGSSNPLGLNSNTYKMFFHPYFSMKDMLGFMVSILAFLIINLEYPYLFSDPDNFTMANPMITPIHIQPEWYFLFAYAILRSIPNKLGGVMALMGSIFILYLMPLITSKLNSLLMYPLNQSIYWIFINNFILLTWAGAQIIEQPFIIISQILSLLYFMNFIFFIFMLKIWDLFLFNQ